MERDIVGSILPNTASRPPRKTHKPSSKLGVVDPPLRTELVRVLEEFGVHMCGKW